MPEGMSEKDAKFQRAADAWQRCEEWYGSFADRFVADMKFRFGDAENGYQWDPSVLADRRFRGKPCLTLNMVQRHNLLITNRARQNDYSVNVVPLGGGASLASAMAMQQLVQRIQHQSTAKAVYGAARGFQVDGGVGYWRLTTRYTKEDSFDHEIYLETCDDPMRTWLDPLAKLPHGGDANFAFEWDAVHKDEAKRRWKRWKGHEGQAGGFGVYPGASWLKDNVRVCEWLERKRTEVELLSFLDPQTGERKVLRSSVLPPEARRELKELSTTRSRDVEDYKVESTVYIGDQEVEKTTWPGSYIPIVRVEGEKSVIDGRLDYRGHTRSMLDAQRMYNYHASGQVEFVAFQSKSPYVGAAEAFEGYEDLWKTANTADHAFLPYKATGQMGGEPLPAPTRQPPPVHSPGLEAGMNAALLQMQLTSGQHENQMGMQGNERTGEAIQSRQAQSDLATSHFDSNFDLALVWTGQQLVELIPVVYDTKRIMVVIGDDGKDQELQVNPAAQQAYMERLAETGRVATRLLNPKVGRYEVRPQAGPDAGTRRDQTVRALTLLLTQAPALTGLIGDLLLKSMNFPEADEAAQRLRRMVPPQAMGEGPSQQEQALQAQVQQLQGLLTKALETHSKAQIRLTGKEQQRDVQAFEAVTKRMALLQDMQALGPEDLATLVEGVLAAAEKTNAGPGQVVEANADEMAEETLTPEGGPQGGAEGVAPFGEEPPHPDAQKAPNGNWYLRDPTRSRGFLRLEPLAQQRPAPEAPQ